MRQPTGSGHLGGSPLARSDATIARNHVFLPAVLGKHGKMGAGPPTLANALAETLVPHLRREFRVEFIRTIGRIECIDVLVTLGERAIKIAEPRKLHQWRHKPLLLPPHVLTPLADHGLSVRLRTDYLGGTLSAANNLTPVSLQDIRARYSDAMTAVERFSSRIAKQCANLLLRHVCSTFSFILSVTPPHLALAGRGDRQLDRPCLHHHPGLAASPACPRTRVSPHA
jgi:hypothetical protein